MKVIKNINNNVSLCLDNNNNEVVAFGKGIGFTKPPYEIPLSKIERTYYDVDIMYVDMINDIPEEIINLSAKIIDYARTKLENNVSSNIVFTLADHIHFAIQRYRKKLNVKLFITYDIQYLYEIEMNIGLKALELIKKELRVVLPKEEAAYIALHIINAESMARDKVKNSSDIDYIGDITKIIEDCYRIVINKDGFNYSRFVSHMHYLMKRGKKKELIQTENYELFNTIKMNYKAAYECAIMISNYVEKTMNYKLTDEECLYLILHINRLCAREDCYQ